MKMSHIRWFISKLLDHLGSLAISRMFFEILHKFRRFLFLDITKCFNGTHETWQISWLLELWTGCFTRNASLELSNKLFNVLQCALSSICIRDEKILWKLWVKSAVSRSRSVSDMIRNALDRQRDNDCRLPMPANNVSWSQLAGRFSHAFHSEAMRGRTIFAWFWWALIESGPDLAKANLFMKSRHRSNSCFWSEYNFLVNEFALFGRVYFYLHWNLKLVKYLHEHDIDAMDKRPRSQKFLAILDGWMDGTIHKIVFV